MTDLVSWTESEEEFMKRNYRRLGATRIAKMLARSKSSVTGKAVRLGLVETRNRSEHERRIAVSQQKEIRRVRVRGGCRHIELGKACGVSTDGMYCEKHATQNFPPSKPKMFESDPSRRF